MTVGDGREVEGRVAEEKTEGVAAWQKGGKRLSLKGSGVTLYGQCSRTLATAKTMSMRAEGMLPASARGCAQQGFHPHRAQASSTQLQPASRRENRGDRSGRAGANAACGRARAGPDGRMTVE